MAITQSSLLRKEEVRRGCLCSPLKTLSGSNCRQETGLNTTTTRPDPHQAGTGLDLALALGDAILAPITNSASSEAPGLMRAGGTVRVQFKHLTNLLPITSIGERSRHVSSNLSICGNAMIPVKGKLQTPDRPVLPQLPLWVSTDFCPKEYVRRSPFQLGRLWDIER